jgi:excinuclease ABC subunit B
VAVRIEFFGDTVDDIAEIDPLRGKVLKKLKRAEIYPGSHYVTPTKMHVEGHQRHPRRAAGAAHGAEGARTSSSSAQRLEQRTLYDLEMLEQVGFCHGIENYSRHLSGRAPGEAPPTLIDYFPPDYLLSSTRATRPSRRWGRCTAATGRARRPSSSSASAARARSTTGR